ncbi:hypothetical protein BDZ85DRAFT_253892 [Elsinoe ampelina]|uniref:RWD domain-containing protein n=1 Tax=Elsinoe ampelina TaxID=302913 RepID=A0A6A6GPA5_9PEZI|nr:hypothetical protein BDZ85DRAFT_253892 [Elsinoe ampelina]
MSDHERQLDELILLQSMYPDEFEWRTPAGPDVDLTTFEGQQFCCSVKIKSYTLEITLPISYPSEAKPQAYLHCHETTPTATRKEARAALDQTINELTTGSECLDILIQDLTSRLDSLQPSSTSTTTPSPPTPPSTTPTPSPQHIKLLLLWSHHLLATSKRKDILSWARELRLSGFSRPGYPGAVVVEGEATDVDEFERRIKALRWQALQVRGEETYSRRILIEPGGEALGMAEVEDLSGVVKALRECQDGLGDWFLEGMKIGHG